MNKICYVKEREGNIKAWLCIAITDYGNMLIRELHPEDDFEKTRRVCKPKDVFTDKSCKKTLMSEILEKFN